MDACTIDTAMAKRMVESDAIRGAAIIGRAGGWSVLLKLGTTEKLLGTQRTDKPRLWRSLDRCVEYVKSELNIARFELLDASGHSHLAAGGKTRADMSERMRDAHQASSYDKWFRAQVGQAIQEADDPATQWVSNEDARARWAKKRAELLKRIEDGAV
jgi:hypothetical protein